MIQVKIQLEQQQGVDGEFSDSLLLSLSLLRPAPSRRLSKANRHSARRLPKKAATTAPARSIHSMQEGQTVWMVDGDGWALATIVAVGDGSVTVRATGGEIINVNEVNIRQVNPHVVEDMTALYHLHEPGVLHNLSQRWNASDSECGYAMKPCTFMSDMLIVVNPLQQVARPPIRDIIADGSCIPHQSSIAEMAYKRMVLNGRAGQPADQSIVITGESGAGKTESSKIVLSYLTARAMPTDQASIQDKSMASLNARLIEQNTILEAFGNAKTVRNDNSSRFGKMMKVQFSHDGRYTVTGASVETYLLEKTRIVRQAEGEGNFRIFYLVLLGASSAIKAQCHLTQRQNYRYLSHELVQSVQDEDDFANFTRSLSCIGIDDESQGLLIPIVAAVLHLGNVQFDEEDTSSGPVAVIPQTLAKNALAITAQLLGIAPEALEHVLTVQDIVAGRETTSKHFTKQDATYARDALAKTIYARLFEWVLARLNTSLGGDQPQSLCIGVLDIFGFENFKRNDFEQLLINYTNEVLLSMFKEQVFESEKELYKSENIYVPDIKWSGGSECVELIAGSPGSILAILNEESKSWKSTSDDIFMTKLKRVQKTASINFQNASFIVHHYAGHVTYSIGTFTTKNNDAIPQKMSALLSTSTNALVRELGVGDEGIQRPRKKRTVAAVFVEQIKALTSNLASTRCNFIRCIKPNPQMRVGLFDSQYVLDQLRCQGILQTAEVLKVGLPNRVTYETLVELYAQCLPEDVNNTFKNQRASTLISAILWALEVPKDSYRLGMTRLFSPVGKIEVLDAILSHDSRERKDFVPRMKRWLARRRWRVWTTMFAAVREFKRLCEAHTMHRAAIKIQRLYRVFRARKVSAEWEAELAIAQAELARFHLSETVTAAIAVAEVIDPGMNERIQSVLKKRDPSGAVDLAAVPYSLPSVRPAQIEQLSSLLLSGSITQDDYDNMISSLLVPATEARSDIVSGNDTTSKYRLCLRCGVAAWTTSANDCNSCGHQSERSATSHDL